MDENNIAEALRNTTLSPGDLSEFQIKLAGEYSFLSSRLAEILVIKPQLWLQLRKETKSDASTDKKWEATPEGIEEAIYKLKLRAIEKQLSAINSRLHILSMEARNQL